MNGYDPWEELNRLVDVTLECADLPEGQRGRTHFPSRTITLRYGLLDAERRSTLAHELVHLERGPVLRRLVRREERAVSEIAARRLIAIEALGEALRWCEGGHELADELGVDVWTLQTRMSALSESDRTELSHLVRVDAGEGVDGARG